MWQCLLCHICYLWHTLQPNIYNWQSGISSFSASALYCKIHKILYTRSCFFFSLFFFFFFKKKVYSIYSKYWDTLAPYHALGLHDLTKYRNTTEILLISLINFDISCGDLVWDLPCVQQASYPEGGPLMWMLPMYLHVNQKSDYMIMMIWHVNV